MKNRISGIFVDPRRSAGALLSIAFLLTAATALAEPQHMLEMVLPRGGTVGTTVDVKLTGRYLDEPKEIIFYDSGVKAINVKSGAKPAEEVTAQFQIAPNARAGEHVLRLRTATGLSEAMTFWVDRYPTVLETEKKIGENDTLEKAQSIGVNTTVEGQIQPGDRQDKDLYWMKVDQGQRISVEVEAARLGTLHFTQGDADLSVRILDDQGKEIARSDDSAMFVQDPVLSVLAPHNGNYYIEIAQGMYESPRNVYYRAHIGNFTRPLAVYPAGGQLGEKLAVKILGDPTGERSETLTLPKTEGPADFFSGPAGQQPPSPNVLRVSSFPNVLKADGDDPTPVPSLPAALNGIYTKANGVDEFRFTAKKDQPWRIQVFARSLGSPMDPKIWIRPAKGQNHLVEGDDTKLSDLGQPSNRGTWHTKEQLDPLVQFKAPADGDYVLAIQDTRGIASPLNVYRVEIEPMKDVIFTHITSPDAYQIPRVTGLIVPQGGTWTATLQVAKGFGANYNGELEIEAVGLPKGVKMIAPRFEKGVTRMPVQFVAEPGAEQQAALIELLARPVDKDAKNVKVESKSRQAIALYNHPGEYPWHYVFLDKFCLAVVKPAPFEITVDPPASPLTRSSEMPLKVKVKRRADFKGPVEVWADWMPPGVQGGSNVTIPADKTEGEVRVQANAKAAVGVYQIAINGTTAGVGDAFSGYGRSRTSAPFLKLEVAEPFLSIELKRASVERGKKGEMLGVIKQNKPLPGAATATLTRLPKGVVLVGKPPEIHQGDAFVTFQVEATSDALLGMYKEIGCEVTVMDKGQPIHQQTGSGILRVDPARVATASR